MLRPSEALEVRHRDVLTSEVLNIPDCVMIGIAAPKTKKVAARRQHVRIDDRGVHLLYMHLRRQAVSLDSKVVECSPSELQKLIRLLVNFHGVSWHDGAGGVTLAGLRAGGATSYYMARVPLTEIQWRGRWSSLRTLEFYIQEIAALTLLNLLPNALVQQLHLFAGIAHLLMPATS